MTIDLKTTIGWCAAVAVACISGTYAFTFNNLKSELEQYKQSEEWGLPDLLHNLGVVSGELSTTLADVNELIRLRKLEERYVPEIDKLQVELEEARTELREAKARLESIEGTSVFLKSSSTIPLGEPGLLLGMTGTAVASSDIYLRVGEESFSLSVGQSHTYESQSTKYTFSYKGHDYVRGYEILVVRGPIAEPTL